MNLSCFFWLKIKVASSVDGTQSPYRSEEHNFSWLQKGWVVIIYSFSGFVRKWDRRILRRHFNTVDCKCQLELYVYEEMYRIVLKACFLYSTFLMRERCSAGSHDSIGVILRIGSFGFLGGKVVRETRSYKRLRSRRELRRCTWQTCSGVFVGHIFSTWCMTAREN